MVGPPTGISVIDAAPALNPFAPTAPVCFISPHLDDVALSCSHFLAAHSGATVVTVFAGAPPEFRADGWNAKTTGEVYAPDALRVRRDEDASAFALVHAAPRWLDLWEAEYLVRPRFQRPSARGIPGSPKVARYAVAKVRARVRASSTRAQRPVVDALRQVLVEVAPTSVVAPVGLYHADHRTVSAACLTLARESTLDWYLYLEMPYAQSFPRKVTRRLSKLAASVNLEALAPVPVSGDAKRLAAETYRSQYDSVRQGLATFDRALVDPERYWRIRYVSTGSAAREPKR
jgi:LmbE family N-acetylglucosaminyl deacetylase